MSQQNRHIIIGTSGHIDHGKSSLVKALTGTDPDRFKEEKQRGMTIDLGYAFLSDRIAFIDVPGHERFIKNMVAGVTTIDLVLLVIAADDGVMPQTREHLDILRVLGLQSGLIALNKIDLAEEEWLELVEDDIRELVKGTFLESAPIIRVSTATGQGLDRLKQTIELLANEAPVRPDRGYFWMPIDRSFAVQGFGTVVTGSVVSGVLEVGKEVKILPMERRSKVRGLQRHGKESPHVQQGDRAAVNLAGIHWQEIQRGNVLVSPEYGVVTKRLDVKMIVLESSPWPIKDQDRLRLHVGTSEVFVRTRLLDTQVLEPGSEGYAQLLLEQPVAVNRGDRFVLRKYSPPVTIGGGAILDQAPLERHKRHSSAVLAHFKRLESNVPEILIEDYLEQSRKLRTVQEVARAVCLPREQVEETLYQLKAKGKLIRFQAGTSIFFVPPGSFRNWSEEILNLLQQFHKGNPHLPGITRSELSSRLNWKEDLAILEAVLKKMAEEQLLAVEGDLVRLPDFLPRLSPHQEACYSEVKKWIQEARYSPPRITELYDAGRWDRKTLDTALAYGKRTGEIVVLGNGLVYDRGVIEAMKELVKQLVTQKGFLTVADFRDAISASRKFAVAVLEYFDEIGLTVREGDERKLKA